MSDAEAVAAERGVRGRLMACAEELATVIDARSECGRAVVVALDGFWRSLQAIAGHEPPYVEDPHEVLVSLDRSRFELSWALREVALLDVKTPPEAGRGDGAPVVVTKTTGAADTGTSDGQARTQDEPDRPRTPEADPLNKESAGTRRDVPTGTGQGEVEGAESGADAQDGTAESESEDPDGDPLTDLVTTLEGLEEGLLKEQKGYLPSPQRRTDAAVESRAELIARMWQRFHVALLRLPADARVRWRTKAAATVSEAGFAVPRKDAVDPDVVVPGLPDGLCEARRLPLDFADPAETAAQSRPEILQELGLSQEGIGRLDSTDLRLAWAARAEQALCLVELDPQLRIALVHDQQPEGLATQEQRGAYTIALLGHLRSAGQGLQEKGWSEDSRLGAAHKLDMVLGGLVHQRPAAPDSWWFDWRTRVSRLLIPLAMSAKYEVIIKPLEELRRDTLKDCTIPLTVKGVSGASEPDVQWVVWTPLRSYAGGGPNDHRGRLVVRPADVRSRG
ncbi:hypothetical protein [Streptomyces sp. NPDC054794]